LLVHDAWFLESAAIRSDSALLIDVLKTGREQDWYKSIKEAPTLLPFETRRFDLTYVADAEWPKRRPIAL
jgi:hypothetical protein